LETLIVDTGSEPAAVAALDSLATRDIQVVKGPAGTRQAWARNFAANVAQGEILIFLDDDNVFLDDGLSRLIAGFANPDVDVVVSTLSLYDAAPGQGPPAADLAFMGQTGMAGLLFNGFGDANFAIRRKRFLQIGGFADDDTAAFDWVFFAAAQAHGLKFGVLQRPAIGYRRDLAARDAKWRKRDLEGPHRRVLGAYGLDRSSTVIAALSQCLSLPLLD
jgi:glycosyltransferase involved in cell wall biosynthesis